MRDLRAFAWSMSRPPPGGICVSCGNRTNASRSTCSSCRQAAVLRDRVCLKCEETYTPRHVNQRFCSLSCSSSSRTPRRDAAVQERLQRHRAGDHSLCAPDRAGHGTCAECGKTVQVSRSSAPPELRRCHDCRRRTPPPAPAPRICDLCECTYVPKPMHRPGQRWCSKSCAQAWRNGARPPYDRDVVVGLPRKRRLDRIRRQRRAKTWDGVTDAEILERDRWRCGICRKAIGKSFRWPDPRSKSIDHIVPISEGGEDTAGNKRAAHLGCNCARMNRGGGEQAALF